MPPKPLSAEYFDGWYADQAAIPTVAEEHAEGVKSLQWIVPDLLRQRPVRELLCQDGWCGNIFI